MLALSNLSVTSALGRDFITLRASVGRPADNGPISDFSEPPSRELGTKDLLNPLVHWTGPFSHDFFRFLYELIVLDGMRLKKFFAGCI
jgi:hypothetical protein